MSIAETVADGSLLLAVPIAMAAGLVSFLSPCVLPLAPGYLAYVAGLTGADVRSSRRSASQPVTAGAAAESPASPPQASMTAGTAAHEQTDTEKSALLHSRVVLGSVLFVAGFTVVFVSYGLLFGSLGFWLLENQRAISIVLGIGVILLGVGYLGLPLLSKTALWNSDRRLR